MKNVYSRDKEKKENEMREEQREKSSGRRAIGEEQ